MTVYYQAYISVVHNKGRGWKWAFFYGPTRNPKGALLVQTGIVEKSTIYKPELIAYQELLKSTRCDMSLKVYASQYLRDLFAEKMIRDGSVIGDLSDYLMVILN
jgi:hypothetical protein